MQQQPFSQQQNAQMNYSAPPQVMSTKDLAYVNDMLAWNLLAMKKAHDAAMRCRDIELKTVFEACGQMHQRHYLQIMGHLNNHLQQ
ncbi:hypothetical protein BpJC7_18370 [Weizmannia acidilactici]|uniref:Spore coat protein n=1 Tax=Weizmannia acidilactici TaxID=2607726 RepID=A0A5J4JNG9_9BACI|nr:hypothetical protein [Weizmannia acidilactici]GER65886.1 hypothetical protein BpJC4_03570 [Weizmannia acidilactici]GER70534.1 hypothetical protein BpJC7_18370 [Weizmannia acidilactici]GER73178.1 hypothetical protein BpPP18_12450 [Weizmannia acidilactici]